MTRALRRLKCSLAGLVLLHATDLSPLWLIGPYQKWFSELALANQYTVAALLAATIVSLATLASCSKDAKKQAVRTA